MLEKNILKNKVFCYFYQFYFVIRLAKYVKVFTCKTPSATIDPLEILLL